MRYNDVRKGTNEVGQVVENTRALGLGRGWRLKMAFSGMHTE
jgi:hypothetical protein